MNQNHKSNGNTRKVYSQGKTAEIENLTCAHQISLLIKSSLGPMSRDKLIVKSNAELLVTNDGRTLLEQIFTRNRQLEKEEYTHRDAIYTLLVNLSRNQDTACGDGTTSVVVLCGEMCYLATQLIDRGIHSLTIIEGYNLSLEYALSQLRNLIVNSESFQQGNDNDASIAARTSLNTKLVSRYRDDLAEICVEAVKIVSTFDAGHTPDVQLRFIAMEFIEGEYNEGANFDKCAALIHGVILKKSFSHENMPKEVLNARIAVLSCPLEPARPKTKHTLNIKTREELDQLKKIEQGYFQQIFDKLTELKVNVVVCQWGMDHEMNDWLQRNGIVAIRWLPGHELERVAMAVGAKICPRMVELSESMLGSAARIFQKDNPYSSKYNISYGTAVYIEGCHNPKVCTILIRASNQLMAEDIKRSLYDAICSVRDSIMTRKSVVGGGAMECEIYIRLKKWLKDYVQRECSLIQSQRGSISNLQQDRLYQHVDVIEAFASSLLCIPQILAENAGIANSTAMVQDLISLHKQDPNNCYHGFYMSSSSGNELDLNLGSLTIQDMRQTQTFENLKMKECVWKLATEMACTILKIDHVVVFQ